MIMKSKMVGFMGLALTVLFTVIIFILSMEMEAKSKVVALKGVSYNVNSSLVDNLKLLIGKKVYVSLDSGKTFIGFVKEVGNHLMHLEKLEGKDYFDALLRIENIIAIDTRFRKIHR